MGATPPIGIIVDLEVISTQPLKQKLAGIGDLFSNLTALMDWELANKRGLEKVDPIAYYVSNSAVKNFLRAINTQDNEQIERALIEGLIVSGVAMIISGNSRPCSGSEHLISHALDRMPNHTIHGLQVGVATFMVLRMHGIDPHPYMDKLSKIGFPTSWKQLGITKEQVLKAVSLAPQTRSGRYTILDEYVGNIEDLYIEVYGE